MHTVIGTGNRRAMLESFSTEVSMSKHSKRSSKKLSVARDLAIETQINAKRQMASDSYTPDIAHQRRVALMIERYLALQNARISNEEA
jgi:hypothetical protein